MISQINLSPEGVKIQGDKIKLEGIITANDGFMIDEDGYVTISGDGTIMKIESGKLTLRNGSKFIRLWPGYFSLGELKGAVYAAEIYTYMTGTTEADLKLSLRVDGEIQSGRTVSTAEVYEGGTSLKDKYAFISHYQPSTTITPVTTSAGNVGLSGLNVASVNWCNDTFQTKTSSDMRLKYDIKPISKAREFILGIKTKLFRFKDQTEDKKQHSGVLAQELISLMDRVGIDANDSGLIEEYIPRNYKDEGMYGVPLKRVNYTELIPYCISVIQEQDSEIHTLKNELLELKALLKERGVI